jgi:hypothetical protein
MRNQLGQEGLDEHDESFVTGGSNKQPGKELIHLRDQPGNELVHLRNQPRNEVIVRPEAGNLVRRQQPGELIETNRGEVEPISRPEPTPPVPPIPELGTVPPESVPVQEQEHIPGEIPPVDVGNYPEAYARGRRLLGNRANREALQVESERVQNSIANNVEARFRQFISENPNATIEQRTAAIQGFYVEAQSHLSQAVIDRIDGRGMGMAGVLRKFGRLMGDSGRRRSDIETRSGQAAYIAKKSMMVVGIGLGAVAAASIVPGVLAGTTALAYAGVIGTVTGVGKGLLTGGIMSRTGSQESAIRGVNENLSRDQRMQAMISNLALTPEERANLPPEQQVSFDNISQYLMTQNNAANDADHRTNVRKTRNTMAMGAAIGGVVGSISFNNIESGYNTKRELVKEATPGEYVNSGPAFENLQHADRTSTAMFNRDRSYVDGFIRTDPNGVTHVGVNNLQNFDLSNADPSQFGPAIIQETANGVNIYPIENGIVPPELNHMFANNQFLGPARGTMPTGERIWLSFGGQEIDGVWQNLSSDWGNGLANDAGSFLNGLAQSTQVWQPGTEAVYNTISTPFTNVTHDAAATLLSRASIALAGASRLPNVRGGARQTPTNTQPTSTTQTASANAAPLPPTQVMPRVENQPAQPQQAEQPNQARIPQIEPVMERFARIDAEQAANQALANNAEQARRDPELFMQYILNHNSRASIVAMYTNPDAREALLGGTYVDSDERAVASEAYDQLLEQDYDLQIDVLESLNQNILDVVGDDVNRPTIYTDGNASGLVLSYRGNTQYRRNLMDSIQVPSGYRVESAGPRSADNNRGQWNQPIRLVRV